jgi:hypothetical protein
MADNRDVPRAIVCEATELDVDLVVLGARGLAGVRAFLGSVSNHVLQHSRCPVLVIPARSASENEANTQSPADVATSAKNGRAGPRASAPRTGAERDARRAVIPQPSRKGTVMAPLIRRKADVFKVLKRAHFPRDTIASLARELLNDVDLDEQSPALDRYGVTRDELISRMGGSP